MISRSRSVRFSSLLLSSFSGIESRCIQAPVCRASLLAVPDGIKFQSPSLFAARATSPERYLTNSFLFNTAGEAGSSGARLPFARSERAGG